MDEPSEHVEQTPAPSGGGSSSPPRSSFRASLVQAATGTVVLLVVVARLVPLLDRYMGEALKVERCGWERWVPTLVVSALILAAVAPTAYRDIARVVTAAKGLLPGGRS